MKQQVQRCIVRALDSFVREQLLRIMSGLSGQIQAPQPNSAVASARHARNPAACPRLPLGCGALLLALCSIRVVSNCKMGRPTVDPPRSTQRNSSPTSLAEHRTVPIAIPLSPRPVSASTQVLVGVQNRTDRPILDALRSGPAEEEQQHEAAQIRSQRYWTSCCHGSTISKARTSNRLGTTRCEIVAPARFWTAPHAILPHTKG
jgi:hypothetical protein